MTARLGGNVLLRGTSESDHHTSDPRAGSLGEGAPHAVAPRVVLAFALEPGRTALALFRGAEPLRSETVLHDGQDGLAASAAPSDHQCELRVRAVRAFLEASGIAPGALTAIAVHAAASHPVAAGTYRIDERLLRDRARNPEVSSASLAARVAHEVAQAWSCSAFAVDPAGRGECGAPEGAESGVCGRSLMAMKAAARRHARAVDRPLADLRLVIVHLGRAVSLCVERGGRIGDVHHAHDGATAIDLHAVLERAEAGEGRASTLLHAAANEIAKVVGGLATVLEGEVDAVLVTGALERAGLVLAEICRRVEWIAPVFLYRDEDELLALVHAAQAVLDGGEPLKQYG
jgi:butyrate kinase